MAIFNGTPGINLHDHYDEVRGYIREQLVQENLSIYLGGVEGRAVVDVGGGEGRDAAWLASMGFEVTLVEPAADMIEQARDRFEEQGVNVNIVQADSSTAVDAIGGRKFDIVLSHAVLMYLPEPQEHLNDLENLLAPGGIISLLTKGYHGAHSRFLREERPEEVERLEADGSFITNGGLNAWAYRPDQIKTMLSQSGFDVIDWLGIRVAHDDDRRPADEVIAAGLMDKILDKERRLGRSGGTKIFGQMLQFIATRP
jgi:2-polyprenyl-3-methyl-5-hydroxy-6-metoxy-1,4-benzoquinol methylase